MCYSTGKLSSNLQTLYKDFTEFSNSQKLNRDHTESIFRWVLHSIHSQVWESDSETNRAMHTVLPYKILMEPSLPNTVRRPPTVLDLKLLLSQACQKNNFFCFKSDIYTGPKPCYQSVHTEASRTRLLTEFSRVILNFSFASSDLQTFEYQNKTHIFEIREKKIFLFLYPLI